MKYESPVALRSRDWFSVVVAVIAAAAVGCGDPSEPLDDGDYFDHHVDDVSVSESVEFTDEEYEEGELSGEMTIEELRDLIPGPAPVWTGFFSEFPVDGDCDPDDEDNFTAPVVVDELPAEIEGVVTLHPRYFQSFDFCGTRQRYQGTYIIQDETAGIHVLRDSRIGNVDVGDHVRLNVRGVARRFSTEAIIAFDPEERLTERDDPVPVFFEELERRFSEDEDDYQVRRIRGEVVVEPTNQNFNEMIIESEEDSTIRWTSSLDRELGNRGVGPKEGDIVELTGPVVPGFDDMEMLIARLGQINTIEAASEASDD